LDDKNDRIKMIACCAGDLSGLVARTGEERRDEKKSTAEIDERHGHCSFLVEFQKVR